uniref:sigma factor n=2 Tax=Pseudomonadota TaxID=1224 RepID=UPI00227F394D
MADALDIGLLYSRHHGWLKGWLLGRLGNHGDAADLAQDTYLRLLHSGRLPARDEQSRAFLVQV